jgi:N-acyl-L-homoserine lactone synthetase
MTQPEPKEIARRLLALHSAIAPRKKAKCVRLSKAQFNTLAGRQKIEETIFVRIVRELRKHKLDLARVGTTFAIVDETTVAGWLEADKQAIRLAIKPVDRLVLQAAWPFPSASKP